MSSDTSLTPEGRVKALADKAAVEVNSTVKAIRYVRTGRELIRSAQQYYADGYLESAYLLFLRFLTLSIEKLKDHPGFKDVPEHEKREMRTDCKRVLPLAEKVKSELLVQYQSEYEQYIEAIRMSAVQEKLEDEKRSLEKAKASAIATTATQGFTSSIHPPPYSVSPVVKPVAGGTSIKGVNYDYDEISDNRSTNGTNAAVPPQPHPLFDRSSKPSRFLSPMCTDSLRTVVIPGDLISKFTSLASTNTMKNVETCGVLCGKVIRDQLVITHLVIPKQSGTPDSCATLNEEEIYTIIDRYSLIQLGWIHTHPTQTSFLSSVDLHTHLSYQLMMSESIAIVVAPSKQESNVFTLTAIGMEVLQQCVDSGFHPHPQLEEPYFTDASHASFEFTRFIIVEDLRH